MKKIRIIAIVSAVFFMIFTASYLAGSDIGGGSKGGEYVEVVVAKDTIPGNSIITESLLEKISVPKDTVHPNAIKDFKDVVDKMTNTTIHNREIIIKEKIIEKSEGATSAYGLAYGVEKGKRAMSIEVTLPQSVASAIKVGNYVDIFYAGELEYTVIGRITNTENGAPEKEKITKEFSKLLLQDIKVLAVGENIKSTSDVAGDNSKEYKTVTLELTPEEAGKITYATVNGKIWLGLRGQDDHEKSDYDSTIIDDLIDKKKFLDALKQEFER